jgi:hypothetical protein
MIEQGQPHPLAHGHEPLKTNVRAVCLTGAVLAGVVVASFLLMLGLLELFAENADAVPAGQFATPNPDSLRAQQIQSLRVIEEQLLEQYRWLDPADEIARIPIARAMEIVANRGLPSAGEDSASPAQEPPLPEAADTDAGANQP